MEKSQASPKPRTQQPHTATRFPLIKSIQLHLDTSAMGAHLYVLADLEKGNGDTPISAVSQV